MKAYIFFRTLLIAGYKYADASIPRFVFLEAVGDDFEDSYTFAMRFIPSNLSFANIDAPLLPKVPPNLDQAMEDLIGIVLQSFIIFEP